MHKRRWGCLGALIVITILPIIGVVGVVSSGWRIAASVSRSQV